MDARSHNIENGQQPEQQTGRPETVGASVLRLAESLRHAFGDVEARQFLEAERVAQLGIADAAVEQNRDESFAYLPPNTVQAPSAANQVDYGVAPQEA